MSPTLWDHEPLKGTGWLFIEFPEFSRVRDDYFRSDEAFAAAQLELIQSPEGGDPMPGCGGVRKLRRPDPRRGKGKRGGLRLIYLQVPEVRVIVLIDVYDKDEKDDLTPKEKRAVQSLAMLIKRELFARFGRVRGK